MTEEQKPIFLEILSHFITSQNCAFESQLEESNEHYLIGSRLFREHFSERPESEIDQVYNCARTMYSRMTHTSVMNTYTGRREMWKIY
jgi:hypothetical protein